MSDAQNSKSSIPRIGTDDSTKYGYLGFYNGKRVEIFTDTQAGALKLAIEYFKPPESKRHLVSVHLCRKPWCSEDIVHTADF